MGIAIAVFVIPAFLAVAALSIWFALRSNGLLTPELVSRSRVLLNVGGFLAAVVVTLFATWSVPVDQSHGWEQLFTRIGVVILGPLVIGAMLLTLRLLTRSLRPVLTAFAAGALLASVPTPFVVLLGSWHYQDYKNQSAFESLCKESLVEIIEHTGQAKSLAFLPDSFVSPPEHSQSEIGSWSSFILNQSLLEAIERPVTKESGLIGKAEFERVTIQGKRILESNTTNEKPIFVYEPIDKITAEYIVRSEPLSVEQGSESGLGGAKIEIYKRDGNKLISRAKYYWSNKLFRSCPVETRGGMFVYHFIAESLNVKNPEGPKRVAPQ